MPAMIQALFSVPKHLGSIIGDDVNYADDECKESCIMDDAWIGSRNVYVYHM